MVDIRPNQLPDAILPLRETDELVVDQGADGVRKAPPIEAVNSVAPVATQAEAIAGSDNTKRMTPLRTKQSIASEVGVTIASNAQGSKADSAVQSVNGKTGNSVTLVKGDVGLGNVDNTSDADKPISTATQTALNLKADDSVVVKSVNGALPVSGNVTVAAEEKRLQDTRTTAIAESFGSNVQFVETAGYSSVGDGGGALYKRVSSEPSHAGKFQSADGAWWEISVSRPTPEMFGAKGDGVSDDTIPLRNFFANTGKSGYFSQSKKYRVTGTCDIPSGFNLDSDGGTILATTANVVQLRSIDTSDVIIKGRLILKGPGKANGGGIGIRLGGNSRCLLSGVSARDIDGWGFYISGGSYDPVSWYDKNQFVDCSAYNCYIGREDTPNTLPDLSNEYSTWMDFHAGGCAVGNKTSAGNNSFIGGKLIGNDYNLSIAQGANSAHGTFTGVQINHAGIDNIVCVGASSGLLFAGCTFFGDSPTVGSLRFSNSRGIILSGCLIEASIFSDGAFNSIILDTYYTNNNFVPIYGGTHPLTIYKRNGYDTGGRNVYADEGYDYVSAYRTANQALTSGADTVILYDAISNSKNLRGKYDPAIGTYFVLWNGVYRVTASIRLVGTVSGGGIKLKRNAADVAYAGLTDYSGVKVANITADIYCNAGDQITAVANVTGSSLNITPAPNVNLSILAL